MKKIKRDYRRELDIVNKNIKNTKALIDINDKALERIANKSPEASSNMYAMRDVFVSQLQEQQKMRELLSRRIYNIDCPSEDDEEHECSFKIIGTGFSPNTNILVDVVCEECGKTGTFTVEGKYMDQVIDRAASGSYFDIEYIEFEDDIYL